MATKINAKSTGGGFEMVPDASGILQIQTNGTTALTVDASQNVSFTNGITLPSALPVASGGTGATTTSGARSSLGAAASGANSDITSLAATTSISGSSITVNGATLALQTGSTNAINIDASQKVGIGTASPSVSLDVGSRTDAIKIPVGTTAQRPSGSAGLIRMNTTTGYPEWYDTSMGLWIQFNSAVPYTASYLIVAGGAAGGVRIGGGGGAGGLLQGTASILPGTTYTIVVGAGGAQTTVSADTLNTPGLPGSNSTALGLTAIGGGGGAGTDNGVGQPGGSGGGGARSGNTNGGAGTSGQGNAGGLGYTTPDRSGGGGGAGTAGAPGNTTGNGGDGIQSSITGTPTYYAGGGGGSAYGNASYVAGVGGLGGGGTGSAGGAGVSNPAGATAGSANTGGGGGGGGYPTSSESNKAGGSGVVIISVPTAKYSGNTTGSPTITTNGANTVLKFTSSGTYTA